MKRLLVLLLLPLSLFPGVALAEAPEPYVESYYLHSYEVFVAAGNLVRARQVVENALYWRPGDIRWWQRLAQIADWQGDSATALRAWWKVAETTDDPQAWQQVRQRAPLAYDHQLTLRVYKELLETSPRDRDMLATVARQYELLGQVSEGLDFLADWHRRYPGQAILWEMQRLAWNQGEEKRAARYARQYMDRYGPDREMALNVSRYRWLDGQREQAYTELRTDAQGLPYDPDLTRRLAIMASELGQWQAAMDDYQTLLDQGDETLPDLYQYITLARYYDRERVVALMERAWQRNGDQAFAMGALYQMQDAGRWQAIDDFLARLSDAQLQKLQQDPSFLRFYANLLLHRGETEQAAQWLQRALELAPGNRETRIAWLWLLVASGDDTQLAQTLAAWEAGIRLDRRYWEVLAAAHMALGHTEQAVRYESRLLETAPGDWERQWQYAQALIAAGRDGEAWPILRNLHQRVPFPVSDDKQNLYRDMRLALSQRFDGGDSSWQLAQQIRQQQGDEEARAEWLAQWALGHSEPEQARAWYLRKQQAAGALHAGSALAYAMLNSDRDAVAQIRQRYAGQLTLSEQLEARVQLDEDRRATATLMAMQAGSPELAGANNQQESLLLPSARFSELVVGQRRLGALEMTDWAFTQYQPFSDYSTLSARYRQRQFGSNDRTQLDVNEAEQWLSLEWQYQRERYRQRLSLGQRQLLDNSETTAELEVGGNWHSDWSASWRYQWRMPADETSLLLLGGSRTGNQLQLNWSPQATWQSSLDWADYEYRDLNDQILGDGSILNLQTTWRPWLSRFSPGLRLRHTRADFTETGDSMGEVRALLPPGADTGPLPQDYNESGASLLLGMPDVHIRPHRLQGWGEIGYVNNSISGDGFIGRLGLAGPLLGRDAWQLSLERQLNTGGNDEDSYRAELQYRIYY
ncbi:MAG: tetratricopeptide repeat protein [Pseudomonadota bacterium]|nr:tetratricopeptide repeat protein [Pseudomonadota bacterium]